MTINKIKFKLIGHKMDFQVQSNHSRVSFSGIICAAALMTAVLGLGLKMAHAAQPGASPVPAKAPCPALLNHTVERLQDEKPQSLC